MSFFYFLGLALRLACVAYVVAGTFGDAVMRPSRVSIGKCWISMGDPLKLDIKKTLIPAKTVINPIRNHHESD